VKNYCKEPRQVSLETMVIAPGALNVCKQIQWLRKGGEHFSNGIRPAFTQGIMRMSLVAISTLFLTLNLPSVSYARGGSAEGGTNLDRRTHELVEFDRLG
jgi:hypothetical protein